MKHESQFKLYKRHKSNPRLKIKTIRDSSISFLKKSIERPPSTRESTYFPTQEDELLYENKNERNYLFEIFQQLKRELLLEGISQSIRSTISTPEPQMREYSLKNPSSFAGMIVSLLKLYFKDEKNHQIMAKKSLFLRTSSISEVTKLDDYDYAMSYQSAGLNILRHVSLIHFYQNRN